MWTNLHTRNIFGCLLTLNPPNNQLNPPLMSSKRWIIWRIGPAACMSIRLKYYAHVTLTLLWISLMEPKPPHVRNILLTLYTGGCSNIRSSPAKQNLENLVLVLPCKRRVHIVHELIADRTSHQSILIAFRAANHLVCLTDDLAAATAIWARHETNTPASITIFTRHLSW